jgi:hypothetical protein
VATWQYDMIVVPRRALTGRDGPLRDLVTESSAGCWHRVELGTIRDALHELDVFVEPLARESETSWGVDDGTIVQLSVLDGRVDELRARLDMRQRPSGMFAHFLGLARRLDLVLVTEQATRCEPTLEAVHEASKDSVAVRLLTDPDRLVRELAAKRDRKGT